MNCISLLSVIILMLLIRYLRMIIVDHNLM